MKDIVETIKVYIRQRPDTRGDRSDDAPLTSGIVSISTDQSHCIYLSAANNSQQNFAFNRIFDKSAQQENVFESVAKPILESALLGYSGTILGKDDTVSLISKLKSILHTLKSVAYGPTSSGKTHTMRGGQNDQSKGIMPR